MSVAILVDAAFFIKRFPKIYPRMDKGNPEVVGKTLYSMCMEHVKGQDLYRILVYDCKPLNKKSAHPLNGIPVDFSKIPVALFRLEFHKYLKMQRKVALRLGELSSTGSWKMKAHVTRKLLKKQINISDLSDMDVEFDITQKGVDMRIGLDIASLSLKGMVNQIILISGDGDFVPAAKLARREGIDFVLDPLWSTFISEGLYEHIDGLKSVVARPKNYKNP